MPYDALGLDCASVAERGLFSICSAGFSARDGPGAEGAAQVLKGRDMPQGKCAFCGTFVTGGGIAMGKHSVACAACAPLANKWLEQHGAAQPKPEPASAEK